MATSDGWWDMVGRSICNLTSFLQHATGSSHAHWDSDRAKLLVVVGKNAGNFADYLCVIGFSVLGFWHFYLDAIIIMPLTLNPNV